MTDKETLAVYASKTAEYAAFTEGDKVAHPILNAFIAALPTGGTALDLGCGPGDSAALMADAGLEVYATDAVPEMIALADRHANVTAKVQTFDQLNGTDLYDGVWANFSLLHADRAALPVIFAALRSALRAGGRLHVAMKLGSETKRDAIGRKYTYVTAAELNGLLSDAGFTVTKTDTGRDKGLDGTYADWIALGADG